MEPKLILYFENRARPELVRVRFVSPGAGVALETVRGKAPGAFGRQVGTFQWTAAAQALSVFLLRVVGAAEGEPPAAAGDGESLVASLDFALGKSPVWLCEMFGSYPDGSPVARRLFIRSNPERRRPGPVVIRLNESILSKDAIWIFVDDERVSDSAVLALAERIERGWKPRGSRKKTSSVSASRLDFRRELIEAFLRELEATMRASDYFSEPAEQAVLHRMKEDLRVGGFGVRPREFLGEGALGLSAGERLGSSLGVEKLKAVLGEERPLRVAYAMGHAGVSAIFWYLKHFKSVPLELQYEFPYAIEIKRWIGSGRFSEEPDLACMGLAPAASMIRDKRFRRYSPMMILPAMTHRIVRPRSPSQREEREESWRRGDWCFLDAEASTSRMYFNQLKEHGKVEPRRHKVSDLDPDQAYTRLAHDPEARAILFFPHSNLNALVRPSELELGPTCRETEMKELVLFVHERVHRDEALMRAVVVSVRHAWLALKHSLELRRRVITAMLDDPEHLATLTRISGIDSIPALWGRQPADFY